MATEYAACLEAWMTGVSPALQPYVVTRAIPDDSLLAAGVVLYEGPLHTTQTEVRERGRRDTPPPTVRKGGCWAPPLTPLLVHDTDLWWVRLESGEVIAAIQPCTTAGTSSQLQRLTVRQQDCLWSARLAVRLREPGWRNERMLPTGLVVPEIPLAVVKRRQQRSERVQARREARTLVARSQIARLNKLLWATGENTLPTADEMAVTDILWPRSLCRSRAAPGADAIGELARQVRQDERQATLLDARAAQIAGYDVAQLAADPHAASILAARCLDNI